VSIYFEIQADDVARARQFYSAVFGWNFSSVPGLPIEYWHIEVGDMGGGLLQRPAPRPPAQSGTNAFVCSFQVKTANARSPSPPARLPGTKLSF